jgi:hypothetical protein
VVTIEAYRSAQERSEDEHRIAEPHFTHGRMSAAETIPRSGEWQRNERGVLLTYEIKRADRFTTTERAVLAEAASGECRI